MKSQGAAKNEANNAAQSGAATVAATEEAAPAGDNNGFFTANDKIDFSKVQIEPLFEEQVDFDTFSKSDFRAVKVKECVAVPKSKKLLQFTLDDGTGTDRTKPSAKSYDGNRILWYAPFCDPRGRRRRKTSPSDGRQPHPGRCEAVLKLRNKEDYR